METFVIRVWTPSDESERQLRGVVEHVRGERRPFEGARDLLAFLDASLRPLEAHAGSCARATHSKGEPHA